MLLDSILPANTFNNDAAKNEIVKWRAQRSDVPVAVPGYLGTFLSSERRKLLSSPRGTLQSSNNIPLRYNTSLYLQRAAQAEHAI